MNLYQDNTGGYLQRTEQFMIYKKLTTSAILTAMSLNFTCAAFSLETGAAVKSDSILNKSTEELVTESEAIVPKKLEITMKSSIEKIYGKENTNEIYSKIFEIIENTKSQRDPQLLKDDKERWSDWYKEEVVYMFYPDQFGVGVDGKPNTFRSLIGMLDYLKDLGVTTIYVLPFADSPMSDSGFDVKDPRNVRADLGGIEEFKEFNSAARKKGLKVKADLILNHFSDQHQWFQEALAGDVNKLNYFIVRDDLPQSKKYKDEKLGWVVEYTENDGTITKRRLIFPEIAESHYRKVTVSGKDYYVYHTFYPFQLDVNWENPEVLYYMLDLIGYWANIGIDIFRLDAIPYYAKEEGTMGENLPKTHEIISLLSAFLQTVAPRSVIQAEACQAPGKILPYFGSEKRVEHTINGEKKEITRTDEVQIAYNFPYMPAIWASLITADNQYFWKAYSQTPQIPDTAAWAIFLRVHDELTLEMVNEKTRELLYDGLSPKGAAFRKGWGVSGRLANFLDNNPDRIGMAFSILLSLPGIPIIYYGDEVAAQNNFTNAKNSAKLRELKAKAKVKDKKADQNKIEMLSYFDSRDINRGPIPQKTLYDASKTSRIYKRVQKLIRIRKENPVMTRGDFTQVKSESPEVFSYVRTLETGRVIIINNLSKSQIRATVNLPNDDFGKKTKDIYLKDLLSDKMVRAKVKNKKLTVYLNPYDAMWLKL